MSEGKICLISCPHCSMTVEIIALNCRIFRCGVFKNTMRQIDPHLPKEQCEKLIEDRVIYGCARPFKVEGTTDKPEVSVCGYI